MRILILQTRDGLPEASEVPVEKQAKGAAADLQPTLPPVVKQQRAAADPPPDARIKILEDKLKTLEQEHGGGSVKSALEQVRTLAGRLSTPNGVLISAMEQLFDAATRVDHPDIDIYKSALRACRENDSVGPLHGLITKLLGKECERKTQSAVDSWLTNIKKWEKEKHVDEPAVPPMPVVPQPWGSSQPQFPGPNWPQLQNFPGPPVWYSGFSYQGARGRGRGRGMRGPGQSRVCFLCKSPDHFVANCPANQLAKKATDPTK